MPTPGALSILHLTRWKERVYRFSPEVFKKKKLSGLFHLGATLTTLALTTLAESKEGGWVYTEQDPGVQNENSGQQARGASLQWS